MQLGRSVAVKAPSVGAALGVISETGAAPSLALYCCATGRVAVSELRLDRRPMSAPINISCSVEIVREGDLLAAAA